MCAVCCVLWETAISLTFGVAGLIWVVLGCLGAERVLFGEGERLDGSVMGGWGMWILESPVGGEEERAGKCGAYQDSDTVSLLYLSLIQ